jgi:hypothetical protein
MVTQENTPESPSSSISWSISFGLQSNLKFTEYVLLRKMISSPLPFEIHTPFELQVPLTLSPWPNGPIGPPLILPASNL